MRGPREASISAQEGKDANGGHGVGGAVPGAVGHGEVGPGRCGRGD